MIKIIYNEDIALDKKKPCNINFRRVMFYVVNKGNFTIILGWFPIGDDVDDGICYIDMNFDTTGHDVILDYNFGAKQLILKP